MRDIDKDRALCAAFKSGEIVTLEEYTNNWSELFTALPYWMDQYERVQQENERLKQALAFYADAATKMAARKLN